MLKIFRLSFLFSIILVCEVPAQDIFTSKFKKKTEFNIPKFTEDYYCIKTSKKYIPGKRIYVIQLGGFKFNFLKFDGYKKIINLKCKLNNM